MLMDNLEGAGHWSWWRLRRGTKQESVLREIGLIKGFRAKLAERVLDCVRGILAS